MQLLLNRWEELWNEWNDDKNVYLDRLANMSNITGIDFTPQAPWYLGGDWLSEIDDKIFIFGLNPATPSKGKKDQNWHNWQAVQTRDNNFDQLLDFNRNCLIKAFTEGKII